ncbi:hypothetical protein DMP14_04915 [Pseudonocardia sp. Ae707_Ps2]
MSSGRTVSSAGPAFGVTGPADVPAAAAGGAPGAAGAGSGTDGGVPVPGAGDAGDGDAGDGAGAAVPVSDVVCDDWGLVCAAVPVGSSEPRGTSTQVVSHSNAKSASSATPTAHARRRQ